MIISIQRMRPRLFFVLYETKSVEFEIYEFNSKTNEIHKISKMPDFYKLNNYEELSIKKIETSYKSQVDAIPSFHKANPDINDKDSLSIEDDVDAFSKLIAYKSLETPLSIGLFGKWGSGKSFFMQKLEKRITKLSNDKNVDSFCKNVVHVKFNAWHYSDTNLLASLVYNIFDAIDEDINDEKNKGKFNQEEQKKLIYKQLASTTKLLEQKNQNKNELEALVNNKYEEIKNKKQEIEKNTSDLNKKDAIDTIKATLESDEIKEDINALKKEFPKEIYNELNDFKNTYNELNSIFSILFKSITKIKQSSKIDMLIYVSFIIISIGLYFILKKTMNNIKELKPLIKNAKNVIDKWDNIKENKLIEKNKDIELEKNRISKFKDELHELDLKINKIKEEKETLDKEIKDIEDGKYFRNFISEKVDSEDYKKHLGLVSLMRNDFIALEKFLLQVEGLGNIK